jgi:outer membrane protein
MKKMKIILALALAGFAASVNAESSDTSTNTPAWLDRPLSLVDALNIALQQNATILKARNDLQASHGVVVQTRAVALPHVTANGTYTRTERSAVENFPLPGAPALPDQNWNANIQITQTIYDGGRTIAALKSANVTKKQAIAQYNTVVADTLLAVRKAYYDVLLANQQITVHQASVNLLQSELEDQQRRYNAGTVPKFNVLRAEVAVANERPNLIQAQNSYRIAKNKHRQCARRLSTDRFTFCRLRLEEHTIYRPERFGLHVAWLERRRANELGHFRRPAYAWKSRAGESAIRAFKK